MRDTFSIRKATESDFDAIWQIFHEVVSTGDTYTYDPATPRSVAHETWMEGNVTTYVALMDDEVVGTYILRPNQPGLGAHVANCGYMVKAEWQGKGIGRAMCEHSIEEARHAGYEAMQYNIVVSTNEAGIALWKKMGFSIVGTLPKAFRHRDHGLVDAYVMHRFL
jgi:L-amino acid N-acyltransferase YncA